MTGRWAIGTGRERWRWVTREKCILKAELTGAGSESEEEVRRKEMPGVADSRKRRVEGPSTQSQTVRRAPRARVQTGTSWGGNTCATPEGSC